MRFGPPTVGQGWHVPQCDTNYAPPLCTDFYHGAKGWRGRSCSARLNSLAQPPQTRNRPPWVAAGADLPRTVSLPHQSGALPPLPPPRATRLATATAQHPPATSARCQWVRPGRGNAPSLALSSPSTPPSDAGEYLFDFRAMNVSVNNQTFLEVRIRGMRSIHVERHTAGEKATHANPSSPLGFSGTLTITLWAPRAAATPTFLGCAGV